MYMFLLSQVKKAKLLVFSKHFSSEIKLPLVSDFKGNIFYADSGALITTLAPSYEFHASCKTLFSQMNSKNNQRLPTKENCEHCDISKIYCKKRYEGQ